MFLFMPTMDLEKQLLPIHLIGCYSAKIHWGKQSLKSKR